MLKQQIKNKPDAPGDPKNRNSKFLHYNSKIMIIWV